MPKKAIKNIEQLEIPKTKKICVHCGKIKLTTDFYKDKGKFFMNRIGICKKCMEDKEILDIKDNFSIHRILSIINRPFKTDVWSKANDTDRQDTWGAYCRMIALNYGKLEYKDGEKLIRFCDEKNSNINSIDKQKNKIIINKSEKLNYMKAQKDVIKILEYDPFIGYAEEDKQYLYPELLPYLDEDTQEDQYKIQMIIQIVNNNLQIKKMDLAINQLSSTIESLMKNSKEIENLSKTKNTIITSNDKISKENEIAVKHRSGGKGNKSALTGMMKDYRELGFKEAEQNYYDMLKAQGMRRTADISNKSILDILKFDEKDIDELIKTQRETIQKLQNEQLDLKEKIRKYAQENIDLKEKQKIK